jgi:hypothetical protein
MLERTYPVRFGAVVVLCNLNITVSRITIVSAMAHPIATQKTSQSRQDVVTSMDLRRIVILSYF